MSKIECMRRWIIRCCYWYYVKDDPVNDSQPVLIPQSQPFCHLPKHGKKPRMSAFRRHTMHIFSFFQEINILTCMLYGMGLRARLLAVQIAEELRASLVKSEFHEHKIIIIQLQENP